MLLGFRCPDCDSANLGVVGVNQYYCRDCCVEFNRKDKGTTVYSISASGGLRTKSIERSTEVEEVSTSMKKPMGEAGVDVAKLVYAFRKYPQLENLDFASIFEYKAQVISYYRTRHQSGKLIYTKATTDAVGAAVDESVQKYLANKQPKERKKSVKTTLKIDKQKVAYIVTKFPEITTNDLAELFSAKYQTIYNYKVSVLKNKSGYEVPEGVNEEWDNEVAAYKIVKESQAVAEEMREQGASIDTERLHTMPMSDGEYKEIAEAVRPYCAELIIPPVGGIHKLIMVAEGGRENATALFNYLLQTFEEGEKYGIEVKISKNRP